MEDRMTSVFSRIRTRKRNDAARRAANGRDLAAETAAVGFPLSANDLGFLKNRLPPHIGDTLLATIDGVRERVGLVQVSVWVRPENIAKIQAIAEDTAPIDPIQDTPAPTEPAGAEQGTTLDAEICAWFRDIQSGVRPQHDLVAEAAAFKTQLDDTARDAFIDSHSIDGRFILRLIDSWATRTDIEPVPVQHEPNPQDERAALRSALRRVHMERMPTLLLENPLQG
jgi:hypothetical protein